MHLSSLGCVFSLPPTHTVSAIFTNTDPNNPGGESLPGEPLTVNIPKNLNNFLPYYLVPFLCCLCACLACLFTFVVCFDQVVELTWPTVPGASGYKVYRTPYGGQTIGNIRCVHVHFVWTAFCVQMAGHCGEQLVHRHRRSKQQHPHATASWLVDSPLVLAHRLFGVCRHARKVEPSCNNDVQAPVHRSQRSAELE